MPFVVPMYEYERSWGSKLDGYAGIFQTIEEANQFIKDYNEAYNSEDLVPDWYIKPGSPCVYVEQHCSYVPCVGDPIAIQAILRKSIWNPMDSAPKNENINDSFKKRSAVIVKFRDDIYPNLKPERKDLEVWNGLVAVMYYAGQYSEWCFAAPVGMGGFSDEYFEGWLPIPGDVK